MGAVKGDSSARVEGTPPDCGGDTVFIPSPEIAVDYEIMGSFGKSSLLQNCVSV